MNQVSLSQRSFFMYCHRGIGHFGASQARRGVTLIELMIVVAIVGIAAGFAWPKFIETRQQMAVESAAQRLTRDLGLARTEAIKRNRPVSLRRIGMDAYRVDSVPIREFSDGLRFQGGAPAVVTFVPFGPLTTGPASFQIALGNYSKRVEINAAGFARTAN
jgi:prepilin-type N-terminal cleavage/methylation domain-containing protein